MEQITEQFKPFPLNPNVSVGNMGTIIRPNKRLASKRVDNVGYLKLSMIVNGEMKSFKQHRVVAITWIPNPLNLPDVNHLNGVKTDISVSNLEWATHQDNIKHGRKMGLWTKPGGRSKGYKHTEQAKESMSKAKQGKYREGFRGKWTTVKTQRAEPTHNTPAMVSALWLDKYKQHVKDGALPANLHIS